MVAAIDADGMWVTNGVNRLEHWSHDLDWETLFAGVDLSAGKLYNNPSKHRLEFIYTDGAGQQQEMHWFYARMKKGGDGSAAPIITGPHPSNVRCRLHTIIDGAWAQFDGGSTATGAIYLGNTGNVDASLGYDSSGSIPFTATTGDYYTAGLGRAVICESGYPKFATGTKDITVTGTFTRDGCGQSTVTKDYSIGSQKKLYWHRYADRHSITVSDISATSLPAVVGYELEVRDAGVGLDT
jgi:hypothetical protein